MKQTAVEFYIDKSKSIRKSIVIFQVKDNIHFPVMYLKKPKWVTDKEFNDLFDRMEIMIKPK